MEFIKPYNDTDMIYNKEDHRYVLTRQFAQNKRISYLDDGELDIALDITSEIVYDYIYNNGNSLNIRLTQAVLNGTKKGRDFIKKALRLQLQADYESGFNSARLQNPVDYAGGKNVDEDLIRRNTICIGCKMYLENCVGLIGYNIFYTGRYLTYGYNIDSDWDE